MVDAEEDNTIEVPRDIWMYLKGGPIYHINDLIAAIKKAEEGKKEEEPVSNTYIYPFCGVVKMPEGWNTFANQETDTNPSECIALLEVRLCDDGKECYYKTLAEDLPIGTYELYLSTPEPTQRKPLSEEEIADILNVDPMWMKHELKWTLVDLLGYARTIEFAHGIGRYESFEAGVRFAEKHHQILGEFPNDADYAEANKHDKVFD
jgi:hypothetical protein